MEAGETRLFGLQNPLLDCMAVSYVSGGTSQYFKVVLGNIATVLLSAVKLFVCGAGFLCIGGNFRRELLLFIIIAPLSLPLS